MALRQGRSRTAQATGKRDVAALAGLQAGEQLTRRRRRRNVDRADRGVISLLEHDLFRKVVPTFRDHALRSCRHPRIALSALEANEREMAERRHWPALDEAHPAVPRRPLRQAIPAEFRAPAQAAGKRREALLEHAPQAGLGAEMIDQ